VKTDGAKHIDDDDKDEVVCHKKKHIDEVHAKAIAKMKAKTDNAVEAVKDMQEEMAKLLKDHETIKHHNDLDSSNHKKIEEDLPHKEEASDQAENATKLLKDHNDLDSPTHKKIEEDLPHKEVASEQAENTANANAQIKKYAITNAQTKPPKLESIAEKLEKAKENSEALDCTINSVDRALSVEDMIANSINNSK